MSTEAFDEPVESDGISNRMWPLDVALGVLGTFVFVTVSQKLSFEDTRWSHNAWAVLAGILLGVAALDFLLRKVASRFVQRSLQLGFLLSILIHLGLATAALKVAIYPRSSPMPQVGKKEKPQPVRRSAPQYFSKKSTNERQQPRAWEAPVSTSIESRVTSDPERQTVQKPEVVPTLDSSDNPMPMIQMPEAPLAPRREADVAMPVPVEQPRQFERQSSANPLLPAQALVEAPRLEARASEPLAAARSAELQASRSDSAQPTPALQLSDRMPAYQPQNQVSPAAQTARVAADNPQIASAAQPRLDRASSRSTERSPSASSIAAVPSLNAPRAFAENADPSLSTRFGEQSRFAPAGGADLSMRSGIATDGKNVGAANTGSSSAGSIAGRATTSGADQPQIAGAGFGSPMGRRTSGGPAPLATGSGSVAVVSIPEARGDGGGEALDALPTDRGTLAGRRNGGTETGGVASLGLPGMLEVGAATLQGAASGLPSSSNRTAGSGDQPDPLALSRSESIQRRPLGSVAPAIKDQPKAAIPFQRRLRRTAGGAPDDASTAGPETEEAIERGLKYLMSQQNADGSWSLQTADPKAMLHSDTAATGLCLLSFQGAGYSHREHQYATQLSRGIDWLVAHQKENGDLYRPEDVNSNRNVWLYSHGVAALALCEAYGMTQDPELKEPAQRSINFIIESQHPTRGGWRYQPQESTDTSVSGWMIMAMKSAELAGLQVPRSGYSGVARWLELSRASGKQPYLFRYNPYAPDTDAQRHGRNITPSMTSVGLLMEMYLGWRRDHPNLRRGAEWLLQYAPSDGTAEKPLRDSYYWYYATQVMFHMGGKYWEQWHAKLKPLLIDSQVRSGQWTGSWDPEKPLPDRWGQYAGRLYVTSMNLLNLEINYRHLPIYEETAR